MNLMTESIVPDCFDLDPMRMPLRVDLDLPPHILDKLQDQSDATGRSLDEIILEIIGKSVCDI